MGTSSMSLLPVIWSMGWAEWYIVSLRRQCFELLNQAITLEFFRLRTRQLAWRSVIRYLSALTLLTAFLITAIRFVTGEMPSAALLISFLASWLLGFSFYLALVLSSVGCIRIVVPCMVVSIAVGLTSIEMLHWQPSILVAPLMLSFLLLWPVKLTLSDPTRHM
jgi:hypothetical protein